MGKPQIKLKQIQRLALSPLQRLSGELLGLSTEALNDRIEQEKEDNPYLEEDSYYSNYRFYSSDSNIRINNYEDKDQIGINTATTETLAEDLLNQLRLSNITQEEYRIGEAIIGNLDEKGYLNRSLSAIADDIFFETYEEIEVSHIEKVLKLIQSFEPAGIGARNHQECLLLQLGRLNNNDTVVSIAEKIIKKYWSDFYHKKTETLATKLSCTEEELEKAKTLILSLNLSPGYIDSTPEVEQYIIPDITLWNSNGEIKFKLNKLSDKKLKISKESEQLLENLKNKKQTDKETIKFLKDKIESAKLFIEAYNNRMLTLHTFMQELIKYQEEYFQDGDVMKLKPMKYDDLKELTGYSESTISKIANDKYIQSHFGTFKIKKLFTKSIETKTGEQVSSSSVRNIIAEMIQQEDPQNPLTDQEIQGKLHELGFTLSRRTITKYRQQIGVNTASKRKNL